MHVKSDLCNAVQHDSLRIGIYNEMESSDITSIDIYDEKENFCTRIQNEESNMNEKHESFGRCDEEENINESLEIQNQELDYEKCHCSCDCLIKICHCSCDYCLIGMKLFYSHFIYKSHAIYIHPYFVVT